MNSKYSILIKLGAISEILFIVLLGNILFLLISRGLIPQEIQNINLDPSANNVWPATLSMVIDVGLKNGLVLLLMVLTWKFIYRKSRVEMNITRNKYSISQLIGIGILCFSFANLPNKLIVLLNIIIPFGEGLQAWNTIYSTEFSLGLVAFVLAGNILLPPILEEAAVRGFQLSRLKQSLTPISAILIVGTLFPLFHGHFYQNDPVIIAQMIAFIFSSIIWTFVAFRCGSLIPLIVAHMLANSPMPSSSLWMGLYLLIMLTVIFRYRKIIKQEIAEFVKLWKSSGKDRLDIFWILPTLAVILGPVLINRNYMFISIVVLFLLIIGGRQNKINLG